jgi:hypothetical protein
MYIVVLVFRINQINLQHEIICETELAELAELLK